MQYSALFQTPFVGMPRPLRQGSHAYTCEVEAEGLEAAFAELQGENMPEQLAWRIRANPLVQHTSLSVGDILIDKAGFAYMVDIIGFSKLELSKPAAAATLALHLSALGLRHTAGWDALVQQHAPSIIEVLADRLLQLGSQNELRLAPEDRVHFSS